jgi:hypothetical protein
MAVIIWAPLAVAVVLVSVLAPGAVSDDQARFHDLGADFYDTHAGTEHAIASSKHSDTESPSNQPPDTHRARSPPAT